jgi:hypothetical protein
MLLDVSFGDHNVAVIIYININKRKRVASRKVLHLES